MKIRRQKRGIVMRIASVVAVSGLAIGGLFYGLNSVNATGLNKNYSYIKANYAVPNANVAWVSPNGDDNKGNGSESAPYKSFGRAVTKIGDGGTVVAKSGIYREPHFFVTKKNVTMQAAPNAEVWLKGSDVVTNWSREGNMWKATGNFQNFCHVCTTNIKPEVEGMAAYPEQVFINDKPLTQVGSKAEVGPGKFYVEDATQTTRSGGHFNPGRQDTVSYYLGSDPTAGTTEISQRTRAFTTTGENFKLQGINISQYAPNQTWGFKDPQLDDKAGPIAISINGKNSLVQDVIVAQNSNSGLFLDKASGSVVKNSQFLDNGGNGAGANRIENAVFENNTFSNNNAAGFETNGSYCTSWCGMADVKVTHAENFTFRNNVVDYSKSGSTNSDIAVAKRHQLPGFWCDEGCINTNIVNNYFTNVQMAIFYEVSHTGIIASNIIEGSGSGILVSGSSKTKIYNNSISRTAYPIRVREDTRSKGCNAYQGSTCTAPESWSQAKGLSWDTTGTEMYNNIISSRAATAKDGDGPYWAYGVRTKGGANIGGPKVGTNEMFAGLDYNVYYRNDTNVDKTVFTWDLAQTDAPIDVLFSKTSDIAKDGRVSKAIDGLERNSLDQTGSRSANPFFTSEAANNNDYNKSNYTIKAGSPAANSGKELPADVAKAIDPSGATVKAGTKVNRGALVNANMTGGEPNISSKSSSTPQQNNANGATTNGQANPKAPGMGSASKADTAHAAQTAEADTKSDNSAVSIPDARLKAAINKSLSETLGARRGAAQDVTAGEMQKLTGLSLILPGDAADDRKATDLTGLEAATNLDWLAIDGNKVKSLAPLAKLTKLTSLTAYSNQIESLDPIAGLTNLKLVMVSGNPIASTKPLAKLTQLKRVALSGKDDFVLDIADVAASKGSLESLSLYDYSRKTTLANGSQLATFGSLKKLRLTGVKLNAADSAAIGTLKLEQRRID
mgnify:FL=1